MRKVYFPQIYEAFVRFKRLKYEIEKGMGDNESELDWYLMIFDGTK